MTDRAGKPWTEEEDEALRWAWGTESLATLAARLNRTVWGIHDHARIIGLGSTSRGTWSISMIAKYAGFSEDKVRRAIEKLGMWVPTATGNDPERPKRRSIRKALPDDQVDKVIELMVDTPLIWRDAKGAARTTNGAWGVGRKPSACVKCGRNDRPHEAKGRCASCYYNRPASGRPGKRPTRAESPFTPEKIVALRIRRRDGATLDALAVEHGVSRQTIAAIAKGKTWKHAGGPTEPYDNRKPDDTAHTG